MNLRDYDEAGRALITIDTMENKAQIVSKEKHCYLNIQVSSDGFATDTDEELKLDAEFIHNDITITQTLDNTQLILGLIHYTGEIRIKKEKQHVKTIEKEGSVKCVLEVKRIKEVEENKITAEVIIHLNLDDVENLVLPPKGDKYDKEHIQWKTDFIEYF